MLDGHGQGDDPDVCISSVSLWRGVLAEGRTRRGSATPQSRLPTLGGVGQLLRGVFLNGPGGDASAVSAVLPGLALWVNWNHTE